jgi:hypothetical protein
MPQTIKLKRSSTPNQVPTAAQLELGEVAINTNDGKMFIKKGDDTIVDVTAAGSGGDVVDDTTPELGGNLDLNTKKIVGDGGLELGYGTSYTESLGITLGQNSYNLGWSGVQNAQNTLSIGNRNLIAGYGNAVGGYEVQDTAPEYGISINAIDATTTSIPLSTAGTTTALPTVFPTPALLVLGGRKELVLITAVSVSSANLSIVTVIRSSALGRTSYALTNPTLEVVGDKLNTNDNIVSGSDNELGHTGTLLASNRNIVQGNSNTAFNIQDSLVVGREHFVNRVSHSLIAGLGIRTTSDYSYDEISEACLAVGRWDDSFGFPQIQGIAQVNLGSGNQNFRNSHNSQTMGRGCRVGSTNNSETAHNAMAVGFSNRTWLDNGFSGGNNSDCFSDSGMAFGHGAVASKADSNFAFGKGITTPVSGNAAESDGQVAVGRYNLYDNGEKEFFSVGTGTTNGSRYTSFSIQDRTADSKSDTSGFCGIVMKALAESPVYVSDHYASLGGVPIGGLYRYGTSVNSNRIRIRVA